MAESLYTERNHARYMLSLRLVVRTLDGMDDPQSEKTELHNISGGGACFFSSHVESYDIGQRVSLDFEMPDHTHEDIRGMVMWTSEAPDEMGRSLVGMCLDDLSSIERVLKQATNSR